MYNPEAKGRGHVLKCTSVSCNQQADVIEAPMNSSHSAPHVLLWAPLRAGAVRDMNGFSQDIGKNEA